MRNLVAPALILLTSCSTGDSWEADYRGALEAEWAELTPSELVEVCVLFEDATDAEIHQFMVVNQDEDGSTFDKVMSDRDIEPDAEQIRKSLDIATEELRETCDL